MELVLVSERRKTLDESGFQRIKSLNSNPSLGGMRRAMPLTHSSHQAGFPATTMHNLDLIRVDYGMREEAEKRNQIRQIRWRGA